MPLLGKYKFSFDTWEFIEVEDDYLEESQDIGDPDVELSRWEPLEGKEHSEVSVLFVDGVRRTENLVYVENAEGEFYEGAFVSIGAGALLMRYKTLNRLSESLQDYVIKRYLLLSSALELGREALTFHLGDTSLEFEILHTDKELSPFVNEIMSRWEAHVAQKAYKRLKPDLMFTDGTVHYSAKVKSLPFVGYVKKHRKRYVPNERVGIFRELQVGTRTPIILIHSQPTMQGEGATSFDKYTWYVKLSKDEGISGIARLEVPAGVGLKKAKELADLTAWLIPKFAPEGFADKRAPQNLLPIKHLENTLRRRLGSQNLIRRLLTKELSKG